MEWKNPRQGKGQNVQSFTKEFRKQALALNICLNSPDTFIKYIGTLYSYLRHSLLLFDPTTLDEASVKVIHLESMGKHEEDDHAKKTMTKKKKEEKPSCAHCKKKGHDEEHCWKLHPELKPKNSGGKGEHKTIAIVQHDLGSYSSDEMKIKTIGIAGIELMMGKTSKNAWLE